LVIADRLFVSLLVLEAYGEKSLSTSAASNKAKISHYITIEMITSELKITRFQIHIAVRKRKKKGRLQ